MIKNYKTPVENIRRELKNYIQSSGLKSIVIGISGGIDSAICAVLAKPVCDELGVKLIARSITIVSNKADEIERSVNIGKHFAHSFEEVNLSAAFESIAKSTMEDFATVDKNSHAYKIRQGNVKARTRMVYLYDLAAMNKGMVLSTDNLTELLLGFWTLHGDVGDYGMIQNLWKTEVYAMSRYLAQQMTDKEQADALLSCVTAVPTDGLGITNSDLDQIGASSYEEVDEILIEYLQNPDKETNETAKKVIQRKVNSEFKRNNPYNLPRELITEIPAF